MNNLQFIALLAPSIGSFVLVILAWIHSNSRITRLEHTVDAQGTELRAELRAVRAEITALREIVYSEMVSLHERVAVVEARLPR